ncbi:CDP-alcohol phosphatidyltransferase family protein [Winslowiella iniecta]|uniref:CDP-alcohol phosphatidyltransferase n=1 Tax=Winslowiella iniecta TaxID=1560201 RepID=A0A0L7T551_9GAMM|nr:CDP-alcohol phosphatidyltransferase family protein [Winslowiella iniecta]KOC90465.1 hypothetical protein NG42_08790 [Winslowiella iniecta]KOC93655.1 hypothetical protein NG43_09270 [Winslowiella iniecta]
MSVEYNQVKAPLLTPNQITLLRFVLTIILFVIWQSFSLSFLQKTIICVIFAAIFILDNIDGIVARKYSLMSLSGHYFDAAVDVITYFLLAFILQSEGILPGFFIALMLIREVFVVYIKAYLAETGMHVSTSSIAVVKCELIGIPMAFLYIIFTGESASQYLFISLIFIYFLTLKLWYEITNKQHMILILTALLPVLIYPAVDESVSVGNWYLYSYMLIAIVFSYFSAFGYFRLFLLKNNTHQDNYEQ